jgi:hypothetical protein
MDSAHVLTSPALLYLFAEEVVPAASGLFKEFALAPRTGAKVDLKQLVMKTYLAGFMDLVESGILELAPLEIKKFLGKETVLSPHIVGAGEPAPFSLGAKLLPVIRAETKPERRRVREVVINVVGGRSSTSYPWLMALVPVIREASEAGLVTMPEKKPGFLKAMFKPYESVTTATAIPERVDGLQGDMRAALARLQAFEARLGSLADMLRKEIESGVKECMENDSD